MSSSGSLVACDEDAVLVYLAELLGEQSEVAPLGEPLAHEGLNAVGLVNDYPFLRIRQETFEDDLGVEQFGTRSHVPPPPFGIDAADDLDVLLRHAYSDSPAASRASLRDSYKRKRTTFDPLRS